MVGWSPPSQIWLNYFYDQSKIGLLFYLAKNKQKQRSMNNFQVLFPLRIILETKQKKFGSFTMSHMSQTHNVPGLWTYKLLRLPFITCCTVRVVAFSKNSTQFIHKTKRHDCEQLLKKIDGLIKSGNSRNNAHSSHGPGA